MTTLSNKEIALQALRNIVSKVPEDELEKKVYHEGMGSYSWPDIIAEIESDSSFGQSYVATLVEGARSQKLSLEAFLNPEEKPV